MEILVFLGGFCHKNARVKCCFRAHGLVAGQLWPGWVDVIQEKVTWCFEGLWDL